MSLKPLEWKIIEKLGEEDWPKSILGASFVYVEDLQKFFLIGGNFNSYENHKTNEKLNEDIVNAVNKNLEHYYMMEKQKVNSISKKIFDDNTNKYMDVYTFSLPEKTWIKHSFKSNNPNARSFQKCVYHKPYIFCFGGIELGEKGENKSVKDLYALHTIDMEWRSIICPISPCDRTDFTFTSLEKTSILYGGITCSSGVFHEDMWMMRYDDTDFSLNKNDIVKKYWTEITQVGNKPGKIRAHSMIYYEGHLYLFGGLTEKYENKNHLYKFSLINNQWELIQTKGKSPCERCYHQMSMINEDFMVIYGGAKFMGNNVEEIYNDIFLYSMLDNVWSKVVVGGTNPPLRFAFSFCSANNYIRNLKENKDKFNKSISNFSNNNNNNPINNPGSQELFILGGIEISEYIQEKEKYFQVFILSCSDSDSKTYWTIRDLDFSEALNDEHFLMQSETQINYYKEKIDCLELEISSKENHIEEMKVQIEDIKKKIYKAHGFIDDQSQTLDEYMIDLETQKRKLSENYEYDKRIIDLKLKLKIVMQRKLEKMMEFFCSNQSLFIKYYDSLKKINESYESDVSGIYNKKYIDDMKERYLEKLEYLRNKFETMGRSENSLNNEMYKYKPFEKNVNELFKEEIDKYQISEDDYNES